MKENCGGVCVVFESLWCDEMVLFMTVGAMALSGGIVWKLGLGGCALLSAVLFSWMSQMMDREREKGLGAWSSRH